MNRLTKNMLFGIMGFLSISGLKEDSVKSIEDICWKNSPQQKEIILKSRDALKREGITSEQKEGYSIFSERLYNTIIPVAYCSNQFGSFEHFSSNFYLSDNSAEETTITTSFGDRLGDLIFNNKRKYFLGPSREDAFRMYLGMPQKNNTFEISDYRPSNEEGNVPYYYKLSEEHEIEILKNYFEYTSVDSFTKLNFNDRRYTNDGVYDDVMGEFKVSVGVDEKGSYISYYDKWDLTPSIYGVEFDVDKIIGKPFEIYNRIYYNHK